MFSWLGNLFGTAAAGEKLVDNISTGIDKIWYTDEEKANDFATARREGTAVYMEWLKSTSGSRLARRFIAFIVVGKWFITGLVALLIKSAIIWTADPAGISALTETASLMTAEVMNDKELVAIVLGFYFLGPAAVDGSKALLSKWASK